MSDQHEMEGTNTKQDKWLSEKRADKAPKPHWERDVIVRLATAAQVEQRRARRWGIFFKALGFIYLTVLLIMLSGYEFAAEKLETGDHTAVVDIKGVIAADEEAAAENVVEGLQKAFKDKHTSGVILRIDSPGGSPVQAGIIYDEILRLGKKHPDTPVYAVIGDVCASGGYYIAAAANKIYADKASIVGSIGVRMDGFGFVGAIDKLGVERRLLTAGKDKALLDPFSPIVPEQVQHIQTLLEDIHLQFINVVKTGRGEKLADDPQLFSGLIWTGEQGVEKGLVDELGSVEYVAREVIGEDRLKNFTTTEDLLTRLVDRIGAAMLRLLHHQAGGVWM